MAPSRSRQLHYLAHTLSERIGCKVEFVYDGPRTKSGDGGWIVQWAEGPTSDQMRELVARVAEQVSAGALPELRYSRSMSSHGEAVTLLLWLQEDPNHADFHESGAADIASSVVGYPNQADEIWHRRADALLRLDTATGGLLAIASVRTLLSRIHDGGWPSALLWLDSLATEPQHRHLRAVR
jgi:hypothetical protein